MCTCVFHLVSKIVVVCVLLRCKMSEGDLMIINQLLEVIIIGQLCLFLPVTKRIYRTMFGTVSTIVVPW